MNPEIHGRRSLRLAGYNYTQAGAYFITICSHDHKCVFGEIRDGSIVVNDWGNIVEHEWLNTANVRSNIELDHFIVMPNHFHAILVVEDLSCSSVLEHDSAFHSPSQSIGAVVRGFKSAVTRQINLLCNSRVIQVWQRNYFDHVIRNEDELNRIREYIELNPLKWDLDQYNPSTV